ncbi:hypothetical protein K456DRAFT_1723230 [Colletotrichum gloeosporioides 23]|nr:hypothetical protein K456DRAFT_1723230 [Colletotrichum gloeosporioides 23]
MLTHKAENTDNSENWLCHGNVGNYDNSGSNCDFDNLVAHASSWKIEGVCRDNSKSGSCGSSFAAPILYFLAKPFPRNCRIQVSTTLLNIVILFNAVKVGCLLTTAFSRKFEPVASVRKPMRVTRPYGEQRSTFWLQLSYRYIVPIMVIMAFMHWSVSRNIYLVQLEIYDNSGELIPCRSITGSGYSPPPIMLSLCFGSAMILLLLVLSARILNPGCRSRDRVPWPSALLPMLARTRSTSRLVTYSMVSSRSMVLVAEIAGEWAFLRGLWRNLSLARRTREVTELCKWSNICVRIIPRGDHGQL